MAKTLEQWKAELQRYYNNKYFMANPTNWRQLADQAVARDLQNYQTQQPVQKSVQTQQQQPTTLDEVTVTAKAPSQVQHSNYATETDLDPETVSALSQYDTPNTIHYNAYQGRQNMRDAQRFANRTSLLFAPAYGAPLAAGIGAAAAPVASLIGELGAAGAWGLGTQAGRAASMGALKTLAGSALGGGLTDKAFELVTGKNIGQNIANTTEYIPYVNKIPYAAREFVGSFANPGYGIGAKLATPFVNGAATFLNKAEQSIAKLPETTAALREKAINKANTITNNAIERYTNHLAGSEATAGPTSFDRWYGDKQKMAGAIFNSPELVRRGMIRSELGSDILRSDALGRRFQPKLNRAVAKADLRAYQASGQKYPFFETEAGDAYNQSASDFLDKLRFGVTTKTGERIPGVEELGVQINSYSENPNPFVNMEVRQHPEFPLKYTYPYGIEYEATVSRPGSDYMDYMTTGNNQSMVHTNIIPGAGGEYPRIEFANGSTMTGPTPIRGGMETSGVTRVGRTLKEIMPEYTFSSSSNYAKPLTARLIEQAEGKAPTPQSRRATIREFNDLMGRELSGLEGHVENGNYSTNSYPLTVQDGAQTSGLRYSGEYTDSFNSYGISDPLHLSSAGYQRGVDITPREGQRPNAFIDFLDRRFSSPEAKSTIGSRYYRHFRDPQAVRQHFIESQGAIAELNNATQKLKPWDWRKPLVENVRTVGGSYVQGPLIGYNGKITYPFPTTMKTTPSSLINTPVEDLVRMTSSEVQRANDVTRRLTERAWPLLKNPTADPTFRRSTGLVDHKALDSDLPTFDWDAYVNGEQLTPLPARISLDATPIPTTQSQAGTGNSSEDIIARMVQNARFNEDGTAVYLGNNTEAKPMSELLNEYPEVGEPLAERYMNEMHEGTNTPPTILQSEPRSGLETQPRRHRQRVGESGRHGVPVQQQFTIPAGARIETRMINGRRVQGIVDADGIFRPINN